MSWITITAGLFIALLAWNKFAFKLFSRGTLYVRIGKNRIAVRRIEDGKESELKSETGFSHPRAIIGSFSEAEMAMKRCLGTFKGNFKPAMLVHPLELVEGGLTQIEDRCLVELCLGAGAGKVVVYTGPELSDTEVTEKVKS